MRWRSARLQACLRRCLGGPSAEKERPCDAQYARAAPLSLSLSLSAPLRVRACVPPAVVVAFHRMEEDVLWQDQVPGAGGLGLAARLPFTLPVQNRRGF